MVKEFDNPADSTIGASFVNLGTDDGKEFQFGYNGEVRVLVNHAVKEIKSIIYHQAVTCQTVVPTFL